MLRAQAECFGNALEEIGKRSGELDSAAEKK